MHRSHRLLPPVREAMKYLRGQRALEEEDPRERYIEQLERIGDELAVVAGGAVFYSNDGHADLQDQQELDKLIAEWDQVRGLVLRKVKARRTRARNKLTKKRS